MQHVQHPAFKGSGLKGGRVERAPAGVQHVPTPLHHTVGLGPFGQRDHRGQLTPAEIGVGGNASTHVAQHWQQHRSQAGAPIGADAQAAIGQPPHRRKVFHAPEHTHHPAGATSSAACTTGNVRRASVCSVTQRSAQRKG